ncbi:MAG TPA: recombinase XerC [Elusimicrobia bacterium]|jgi:integrase/recombinase XerC/integrase/recombinase XerD|nr:recombinase XerC [Elusimicrobiota bacterium]
MLILEGINNFMGVMEVERNLSSKTRKAYLCDLRSLQQWLCKDVEIDSITTDTIRSYLVHISNDLHCQDTTIRRKMSVLKNFFGYLEDECIIDRSPIRKIRTRFKTQRKLPRVLTPEEVNLVLKAPLLEKQKLNTVAKAKSTIRGKKKNEIKKNQFVRDRAIIELLFATGTRVGELVGLDVDDVNLKQGTALVLGKGNKERIVYFCSEATKKALRDYLKIRTRIKNETKALFLNRFDTRLSATSIEKMFRNYRDKTGIEKNITPHCLRHTMATMLVSNGADIRTVQEILGHASISTTQIYTEVSPTRQRQIVEKYNPRNNIK